MNNMEPSSRKTPQGSLLLLPAVAALILVVLICFGVLPSAREIDNTRTAIARLQADLRQQDALRPVIQSLQERRVQALPEGVHVHAREPLKIDDLAALPEVFEALARKSGVELISATPQVRSLQDGREMLRVDTRMRGEFLTFNALLNRLNEMRFIETIENLAIDVTELGHEMRLSVWLAIQ